MIDCLMVAVLVLTQTPAGGQATNTAVQSPCASNSAARTEAEQAALAEYNARRQRMGRSADDQMAMARWCQEHGLRAEALVHAAAAVERDPRKDAAWKLLGFQKIDGRWLDEGQAREELEQKKADREWAPRLTALHKALHGPRKQTKLAARKQAAEATEAREALARIEAPRAVPAVYREFARGTPDDQVIAVQIFGQIPSPLASKALAALAIYGSDPEVRRKATETLRGREPADYVDALLGLLVEPLRFEVRPDQLGIGGIGSPGVLVIEGEYQKLQRTYVGVNAVRRVADARFHRARRRLHHVRPGWLPGPPSQGRSNPLPAPGRPGISKRGHGRPGPTGGGSRPDQGRERRTPRVQWHHLPRAQVRHRQGPPGRSADLEGLAGRQSRITPGGTGTRPDPETDLLPVREALRDGLAGVQQPGGNLQDVRDGAFHLKTFGPTRETSGPEVLFADATAVNSI